MQGSKKFGRQASDAVKKLVKQLGLSVAPVIVEELLQAAW